MKLHHGLVLRPLERELIERLESDEPETKFVFIKAKSIRREARGTRNLRYVPRVQWPKSIFEEVILKKVNYYDFDRKDWRSFEVGSVLDFQR